MSGDFFTDRAALISKDNKYRYWLKRRFNRTKPDLAVLMLNPNFADTEQDDPTIKKLLGFAQRWGYGSISVVNLFAYRATDPRDLRNRSMHTIVGPANDWWISQIAFDHDLLLAWSYVDFLPCFEEREAFVKGMLAECGNADRRLLILSLTSTGRPSHPSRHPYINEPMELGRSWLTERGNGET